MCERQLYPTELSRITGVGRRTIYGYLQGDKQPSAFNLIRLSKGLKISSDWLLGLK